MKGIAIVTGGTRGIGAEISKSLHKSGYDVIANYHIDDAEAKNFSATTGIRIRKFDVSDFEACQREVKAIEKEFDQGVRVLVNNAGIAKDSMMHKMSYEDWHEVLQVNLTSCFNMCRSVIETMRRQQYGRIVNISSVNARSGQVGQVNYVASKAGIIGLTKSLALESASKNITVNAIAPGYVKTSMLQKMPKDILEKVVSMIPIRRLGMPHEIARAVLFLVEEEAAFITGETLSINGGHTMT